MKGIVAYSFALRDHEPNPCNLRLAKAVKRIRNEYMERGEQVVIVAQKSVAIGLQHLEVPVDYVVTEYKCAGTTDTEEITAQAIEFFDYCYPIDLNFLNFPLYPLDEIIPVAHLIQLIKCRQEFRRHGIQTRSLWSLRRKIGRVGFDPKSKQWWTRGPVRLVIGAMRQILFGFNTRQNGPTELLELR